MNKNKRFYLVAQRFINARSLVVGLLSCVFEDMSGESRQVVGLETVEAFMKSEVKYLLKFVN